MTTTQPDAFPDLCPAYAPRDDPNRPDWAHRCSLEAGHAGSGRHTAARGNVLDGPDAQTWSWREGQEEAPDAR